jgi:hypothetical protein
MIVDFVVSFYQKSRSKFKLVDSTYIILRRPQAKPAPAKDGMAIWIFKMLDCQAAALFTMTIK